MLPASSGAGLYNGRVSARPSVSIPTPFDRYLPSAPERSSERAASMLRSEEDRRKRVRIRLELGLGTVGRCS